MKDVTRDAATHEVGALYAHGQLVAEDRRDSPELRAHARTLAP